MKKLFTFILFLTSQIFAANSIILVGSTFDYPPVTYIESGQYKGHDIRIMQAFAKDNNLTIKFVKTTWPTLSKYLLDNKFTIAIGGISATTERKQLFLLSSPIGTSRKVPLIRCADMQKFNSVSKINSPNTRIVENIGGTNQKFAEENFSSANIILVNNNQLPFAYLSNKKADVMFTDNIEAEYKHQKNPKLCIAKLEKQFPASDKIFLFNKTEAGQELNLMFNKWWAIHKKI